MWLEGSLDGQSFGSRPDLDSIFFFFGLHATFEFLDVLFGRKLFRFDAPLPEHFPDAVIVLDVFAGEHEILDRALSSLAIGDQFRDATKMMVGIITRCFSGLDGPLNCSHEVFPAGVAKGFLKVSGEPELQRGFFRVGVTSASYWRRASARALSGSLRPPISASRCSAHWAASCRVGRTVESRTPFTQT